MSEAFGLVAAGAVTAQALFGESGGGIASRLHAALSGELSRARADAAFAGAAGIAAGLVPDARLHAGPAASGRRHAALDASAAERGGDTRVRVDARHGRGDGETGWHARENGAGGEDEAGEGAAARDDGDPAHAHAIAEGEVAAIRIALASVRAAAIDIGCDGALQAIVLSGEALNADIGACATPCRLLVLCFSPDGTLGETRHVWGFGYEEDDLVLTLDAIRETGVMSEGVGPPERTTIGGVPTRWRVTHDRRDVSLPGGACRTVRCEHVGGRHEGIVVTSDADTEPPSGVDRSSEDWTLVVQDCSAVSPR